MKSKKCTNLLKRTIGILLAVFVIIPIVPVTEVKALAETEALAENTSSTIDIYKYLSDYILNDEYNDYKGTPSYRTFDYWLYYYEPSAVTVQKSLSENSDFVNSVKAWEYANIALDPSSAYSKSIDIRKYYSSIILDMLDCSYTEDTYVNAINNKNVKDTKNAVSLYNQFCKFYKECMKADVTGNSFLTEKQKNDLLETQKAFLKENKLLQTGEAMDNLFNILDASSTAQECIESFISYCNVATVCDEWKRSLQYMYDKCDKSNYMLSDTLSSFVSASKSIDNAVVEYWKNKRSELVSEISKQAISDLLELMIDEVPFLKGMQIGKVIGTSLSNMLFGTDKTIEMYYKLGIYREMLALFRLSIIDVKNQYISDPTSENGHSFLVNINMLYSVLKLGNTYGGEMADNVYTQGLVSFALSNKDNYESFKKSNDNLNSYLDSTKPTIFTDGIYALEDTDPETYNCYAKIFDLPLVKINVPVTGVSVDKDEIVIDLGYSSIGYNGVTVYPENASDKGYKMKSADTSVVSDGPIIEGKKVGETTMTVTTNDGGYTAVFKIRVIDSRSEVPETDYTKFNYSISNGEVEITGYKGNDTVIKIPSKIEGYPVTTIGIAAFYSYSCENLTSITIPDSVTSIGEGAFTDCTNLETITIPKNAKFDSTYGGTFNNCTSLKNVKFSIGIEKIPAFLFDNSPNLNSLTSITIPDSVTSIGNCSFRGCTGLTSITIPDSVTSIGDSAFSRCTGLTSIIIPDSVTSIDGVFSGCTGLTSITIPDNVTSIGYCTFSDCTGLTSITIPDSVTSIGGYAFSGCTGLTSITIPDNVTTIGYCAFSGCTGLTNITIPDSVTSIDGSAFRGCTNLTIYCYQGSYAEKYAKSNNITYKYLEGGETKPVITNAAAGNQSVYLEWTAVSGAEKYAVYYTVGGKWYNAGTTAELSMNVTGLTNGTKYGFAVKAYVNGAWTGIASSDIVYATPVGSAAAKPVITKAQGQDGRVALNWTTVDGATNYAVYTYLNGKWSVAGYRTAAGMYVTGLTNGTKYGFAVKAYVNGAWTGIASSDIVYATPVGSAAVVKPKITKAQGQDGRVALNWTTVDGATNYAVYTYLNGKWTVAGYRTAAGMYVTGLTNGTKYGFAVKAYVNGAWTGITSSDIVYATPVGSAAVVKPKITKAQGQDGRVALNWTTVDGATNYAVYTYLNGKWSVAGYRTAAGMYVTGLTNGTRYGFAVKAYVNGAWTGITSSDIVYATPTAAKADIVFAETDGETAFVNDNFYDIKLDDSSLSA